MEGNWVLCDPIARYSNTTHQRVRELGLFDNIRPEIEVNDIKVVELFAGVGGFRIGLERASKHFKTIWSNQWEPSTKRQDASIIYCRHFGAEGHSNEDIATVQQKKYLTATCFAVVSLVKIIPLLQLCNALVVLRARKVCFGGKSIVF